MANPDAAAAEAAERKRVMEAVAHMLDAAVASYDDTVRCDPNAAYGAAFDLAVIVNAAVNELRRTPVGREKNQ